MGFDGVSGRVGGPLKCRGEGRVCEGESSVRVEQEATREHICTGCPLLEEMRACSACKRSELRPFPPQVTCPSLAPCCGVAP
jgi:hypothetical protein